MKITVTGGAGFIGSHVVERLLVNGHMVRVVDNLSTGTVDNLMKVWGLITFVNKDVATTAGADRACAGVDAVIHLAARPSVAESMAAPGGLRRDNLLTTLRVLEAAERYGVRRVVYASTCAVYAEKNGPLAETDPVAPASPYAEAKFAGEQAVREFGERTSRIDSVALRLFNVVGPRQRRSGGYAAVVPAFVDSLLACEMPTTYGDGEQTRDFVDVVQVASVFVNAAERGRAFTGSVINVGSGASHSVNEVFIAARKTAGGGDGDRKTAPARPGEMRHVRANVFKLWNEMDMRCTDRLEESITEYANWKRGEK